MTDFDVIRFVSKLAKYLEGLDFSSGSVEVQSEDIRLAVDRDTGHFETMNLLMRSADFLMSKFGYTTSIKWNQFGDTVKFVKIPNRGGS